MSAAEQWLANPVDFAAGVALYQQLGGSSVYQQLFAQGETGYSRQLLVKQLQQLVGHSVVPAPEPAPVAPPTAQPAPMVPAPAPMVPAPAPVNEVALEGLRVRKKACRDERDRLRAQLTAPRVTKTDRKKMAARICALTDEVYQIEEAEKHVLEHGRLPGPVALGDLVDPGELQKRLTNLIAHRSRIRRRPERAGELPGIEADIQLIRQKLNTP